MKNSQKLLKKIQTRKVIQKSRLEFTFKNILFWTLFAFSIIIGGLSFSVIIFAFSQTEFDLLSHITDSKVEFFLGILPFFWIISCTIFLFISIFGIRHTKTGYRYSPFLIFGSSIILSIILGASFFFTGGAEKIEQIFAENIPIYESVAEKKMAIWSMPKQGFLSGEIIEKEAMLIIEDWSGKKWKIDFTNALVRGRMPLNKGEKIKIIGKISEGNIFVAEEIRPWGGGRMRSNER
jgi:hypothetical protein